MAIKVSIRSNKQKAPISTWPSRNELLVRAAGSSKTVVELKGPVLSLSGRCVQAELPRLANDALLLASMARRLLLESSIQWAMSFIKIVARNQ